MATLIRPDGSEEKVHPRNGKKFALDELQSFVGGFIELTYTRGGREMFINEEGKLEGLPINLKATLMYKYGAHDPIVGNAVVMDPEEEEKDEEE